MKIIIGIIMLLSTGVFLSTCSTSVNVEQESINVTETITFSAEDGLTVTADLYKTENADAPYIILFHRAGWSRGEYRVIAPRLNENGFNCLAVDQRSGKKIRGVINQTAAEAKSHRYSRWYTDALPDLKAAFLYVKEELKASKIILWGSSYSAAFVFIMGEEFSDDIKGILSFSPGYPFKVAGKEIWEYARNTKCPVFITAEKRIKNKAKTIYGSVPFSADNIFLDVNTHGSSLLWTQTDATWEQVISFLNNI